MTPIEKRSRPPLPVSPRATSGVRLLTYRDLRQLKGVPFSRAELRRRELKGTFPGHIRLGEGLNPTIAWIESEVDDYIAARMAVRDAVTKAAHCVDAEITA
jgi:predicted DNA-binding transcriptional regulator AlpA